MNRLKIAVIGGGSSYTPEIIEGFIKRCNELPIKEIYLVDVIAGEEKLSIIADLAKRMVKKVGLDIKIVATLNRREALKDADFVVTQFRVGGLSARVKDERFPLKYNVIGQETTGPGGMAKAFRTIPVILDICKDMKELCKDAWLINFTNPSGMVTEAVLRYTDVKCIGLCNVPIHMTMDIAEMMEATYRDIFIEFIGLNHLVWGKTIWHKGIDVTEQLLDKISNGSELNMKNISDIEIDKDFLKSLKMLPCPYHRYYYMMDDMLKEELADASDPNKGTRAEQVQDIEKKLFELYKVPELNQKPKELEKRGGAYYSDAAVSLISAIYNDKREIHVVNTKNYGTIKSISDESVIETNCMIDSRGATPLNIKGDLPVEILGLLDKVKSYETLAIDAAVKGDKAKALMALVNHPLVPSVGTAKKLLGDLFQINKEYLPQFHI